VSQIVNPKFQQAGQRGPANDSEVERSGEEFRENRHDVKTHARLQIQQTVRQIYPNCAFLEVHVA
jgi:hypothetical protein